MYAGIMGKKTGANAGVDSNWNKGELHFYAVGDAYAADTPNFSLSGNLATFRDGARMGIFGSSQNNTGEAWIGRASDRSTGTMTVQLGNSADRNFEVVDNAWSVVIFNAAMNSFTYKGNAILHAGNYTSYLSGSASATFLNSSNYINRTGSSGTTAVNFQNTPAGSKRYQGDDSNVGDSPGGTWWHYEHLRHSNSSNYWGTTVAWGWEDNANKLAVRNIRANSFEGWVYYLNSSNYTSYSPSLTGSGASGTWGISISGTAAIATSASSLAGGGTINNANFNGIMQFPSGGGGATFGANHYAMGKDVANGGWSHPHYGDLIIGYHTGIRIGGAYSGTRFYSNSPTTDANNDGNGDGGESLLMTVGGHAGGSGVIINNTLTAGNALIGASQVLHAGNYTSYSPPFSGGTLSGTWYFNSSRDTTSNSPPLQAYSTGSAGAIMSFHRAGVYAINMGLDSDNVFRIGGWSAGNNRLVMDMSGNLTMAGFIRPTGNVYIDQNYGHGHVGLYDAGRYQGVFFMGDSYKMSADGTSLSNMYGIGWSHPNAGGAAGNLTDHGMLIINNGGFRCAISNSIVASGNITAYSDERLKKNWRDMPDNFVERLAQVRVGCYERIDDGTQQVGVSAQSLQPLLPEAIQTAKDEIGTLSVSYGNAAMASAVELAKELVALKHKVTELEARIH